MEIRDGALALATLPVPLPAAYDVLIKVAYAGVNRADLLQVSGNYAAPEGVSPLPGLEVSGHIAALGENTWDFSIGDPVCALLDGGGYAQYATAPAGQVVPLPSGITLKEAATLPEAMATSTMALTNAGRLSPGERVLIHGASSGVGLIMAQAAKCWHAQEVFGIVGSDEKAELLREYGITPINHRTAPFAEQVMAATNNEGVDLIVDTLGGPMVETHLRLLRKGGRLVTLAMLEGSALQAGFKITRLVMNNLSWTGVTLRDKPATEKAGFLTQWNNRNNHIWPDVENRNIRPHIDSVFPLVDAKKALNRMHERLHMGKILLEVAPAPEGAG